MDVGEKISSGGLYGIISVMGLVIGTLFAALMKAMHAKGKADTEHGVAIAGLATINTKALETGNQEHANALRKKAEEYADKLTKNQEEAAERDLKNRIRVSEEFKERDERERAMAERIYTLIGTNNTNSRELIAAVKELTAVSRESRGAR